jgi:iron complex outermembrane receptor protein
MGSVHGTIGMSGVRRVEQSLGTSHLTPPYNQNGYAGYLVEDLTLGKFDFTFGLRGDQNVFHVSADPLVGAGITDVNGNPAPGVSAQTLKYSAVSGAVGGVYHITDPLAFAVNVGRGYRNPIPFELFAFGVHEGSNEFLIGNPSLSPETSLNTDASIRWSSPRVKAEIGVFRNDIHDFIYSTFTPNVFDKTTNQILPNAASCPSGDDCGTPVVQSAQANATISGVDGALSVAATDWLSLKTVYNLVRGYNDSGDVTLPSDYLPHVPADNLVVGGEVHGKSLGVFSNPYVGVDWRLTAAHDRIAPNEIPTPGYGLVDLHTGLEVVVMNNRVSLDAGVSNLLDKGYIDFNSIVKPANIQNPGRNIYVRASVPFGS